MHSLPKRFLAWTLGFIVAVPGTVGAQSSVGPSDFLSDRTDRSLFPIRDSRSVSVVRNPDDAYWVDPLASVEVILVDGDSVYVGGQFSKAGTADAKSVALWDGTDWRPLGNGIAGTVFTMVLVDDTLFVGGDFTSAGGDSTIQYVARWREGLWGAVGGGVDGPVRKLLLDGGALYAGGDFTTADGELANHIAKWDGSEWFELGLGLDDRVYDLAVRETGDLIAGGRFLRSGTTPAPRVAIWNGSEWSPLGGGVRGAIDLSGNDVSEVRSVVVDEPLVYVAGQFCLAGGIETPLIAVWDGFGWAPIHDERGENWVCWRKGPAWIKGVHLSGSKIYVSSYWNPYHDGGHYYSVLRFDGRFWEDLGGDANAAVNDIVEYNGQVLAGGAFHAIGGVPTGHIAIWDGKWSRFEPVARVSVFIQRFYAEHVDRGVRLTWDIFSDEETLGFRIYRKQDNTNTLSRIADENTIGPDARQYVDSDTQPGADYVYVLSAVKADGSEIRSVEIPVSIPGRRLSIDQNYPNPFNPSTTVSYSLPVDAHTRVSVYDARGGFVTTLVDEPKLAGEHSIAWDGRDRAGVEVATGIYFVRLESNKRFRTRKILLLK